MSAFGKYLVIVFYVLCIIGGTVLSIYWYFGETQYLVLGGVALVIFGAVGIIKHLRSVIKKVTYMFNCMESDDFTFKFSENRGDKYSKDFNASLNRIKSIVEQSKQRIEERNAYFELIMNSVRTGVITLDDNGNIVHVNRYALNVFERTVLTHVNQLDAVAGGLKQMILSIGAGERGKFELVTEKGRMQLSIMASQMSYDGRLLKIVTFNDINNELDDMEVESWIKLARILSHEIMNSLAPVTSLTETLLDINRGVEADLKLLCNGNANVGDVAGGGGENADIRGLGNNDTNAKDGANIAFDKEELKENIISGNANISKGLQTIKQTSMNLEEFVKSYRRFTHIPEPVKTLFELEPFMQRVCDLIIPIGVKYRLEVTPADISVFADEGLLTQVVTNILKNAVYAVMHSSGTSDEKITVLCAKSGNSICMDIANTGDEIPKELSDNIFVPFFTTKETGSGIGLSISRQIMFRHSGSLSLISNKPGNVCFRVQLPAV